MLKSFYRRRLFTPRHFFVYPRRAKLEIRGLLLCTIILYIAYSVVGWHGQPSNKLATSPLQPHQKEDYDANHEPYHVAAIGDSASEDSHTKIRSLPPILKARDSDYDSAYTNGRRFMCEIENYDSSSGTYPSQSQWKTPQQLEDYGWVNEPFFGNPELILANIAPALADLGLSNEVADWEVVDDVHFQYTPPGGTAPVRGTAARFAVFYNFKQGGILCQNTVAPRQSPLAIRFGIPIPPLERLSDNLFINWFRLAGPDPGPVNALKYVFRFAIQNSVTRAVISAIETKNNIQIGEWPGTTFIISENDEGADGVALLGTPNGVAVAFLLSQHKAYFPDKTVSSATVWTADNPDIEDDQKILTHMVFTLATLSPPDPEKWGCCDTHGHRP